MHLNDIKGKEVISRFDYKKTNKFEVLMEIIIFGVMVYLLYIGIYHKEIFFSASITGIVNAMIAFTINYKFNSIIVTKEGFYYSRKYISWCDVLLIKESENQKLIVKKDFKGEEKPLRKKSEFKIRQIENQREFILLANKYWRENRKLTERNSSV